jgi:hypothetical protein
MFLYGGKAIFGRMFCVWFLYVYVLLDIMQHKQAYAIYQTLRSTEQFWSGFAWIGR